LAADLAERMDALMVAWSDYRLVDG